MISDKQECLTRKNVNDDKKTRGEINKNLLKKMFFQYFLRGYRREEISKFEFFSKNPLNYCQWNPDKFRLFEIYKILLNQNSLNKYDVYISSIINKGKQKLSIFHLCGLAHYIGQYLSRVCFEFDKYGLHHFFNNKLFVMEEYIIFHPEPKY